jgi:hypothetical protein
MKNFFFAGAKKKNSCRATRQKKQTIAYTQVNSKVGRHDA